MLLLSIFIAEALLVSVFVSLVSQRTSFLPHLAKICGSGLVYGAYSKAPIFVEVGQGFGEERYVIRVTGLHITLINPSPTTLDVVLLAHIPGLTSTYKVVNLLTTYGIFNWSYRDEGVEEIKVDWFRDRDNLGIRMPPHTSASFVVPAYQGEPTKILACTPTGCVELQRVGEMEAPEQITPEPWVISYTKKTKPQPSIHETWRYLAYTVAGPLYRCSIGSGKMTIMYCLEAACCISCPNCMSRIKLYDVSRCQGVEDTMVAYSVVTGMPPNIVAAYISTDPNYNFKTPTTIRIGGYTYRLYGLDKEGESDFKVGVENIWTDYNPKSCLKRVVTMTITIKPTKWIENATFEDLWPHSYKIFTYVGTKGKYISSLFELEQRDSVNVDVWYRIGNSMVDTGDVITSTDDTYVDNSEDLASKPETWIIPINAEEIVIFVTYVMEGPRNHPESWCFSIFCGDNFDRDVRLGFYVELIPSGFLD